MSASANIKKGQANGQDIGYGSEANTADATDFVLVLDENDKLYCNGVHDEPSTWLVNSIQNNGWQKGETIKCVNRGRPGRAFVLVVADGRSRIKATIKANEERVRDGLVPVRPEFVLVTEDEGYALMHTSANKQERKPLFEAKCWAHHKRMHAREIGKSSLDDGDLRDARKAYAELRKCTTAQCKTWDLMLSAHPEVLRMFDASEKGLNRAALLDIVNSTAFADQPEAAKRIVAMWHAKHEPIAEHVHVEVPFTGGDTATVTASAPVVTEPAKFSRGTRSERMDRRAALGIDSPRPITAKKLGELLTMLNTIEAPELVDPRVMLALILGQSEFDGLPISDHPSMSEVVLLAKRVGIAVSS